MIFAGSTLGERLDALRACIARATDRAGRAPGSVVLVGVTKGVPAASVRSAVQLGLTDVGENRVQEAGPKIAELGRAAARWHLIGHLQRNKAGRAVELFDVIHGIDGVALAEAIGRRAAEAGRTIPVLVEVNVSGEASKFGVTPADAPALVEAVNAVPHLRVEGLMTVGRAVGQPDEARAGFAALRLARDDAARRIGRPLPELSMGMSADFEVAIEEGSTMVRIGTALFGPRAVV